MKKYNSNIFIFVLICVAISFFVLYYFLYGIFMGFGQYVFNLSYKADEQAKQNEERKNSLILFNTIQDDVNHIDSYVIGPEGEVAFIDEIEGVAKNLGLKEEITSVQIEKNPSLNTKGLVYLSLKMSVKGTWKQVYTFMSTVPNMPYNITVDQFDLNNVSDTGTSSPSVWQETMTLKVLKKAK